MDSIKRYNVYTLISDLQQAAAISPKGHLAKIKIGDYEQCRDIATFLRVSVDETTGDVLIECDPHQLP